MLHIVSDGLKNTGHLDFAMLLMKELRDFCNNGKWIISESFLSRISDDMDDRWICMFTLASSIAGYGAIDCVSACSLRNGDVVDGILQLNRISMNPSNWGFAVNTLYFEQRALQIVSESTAPVELSSNVQRAAGPVSFDKAQISSSSSDVDRTLQKLVFWKKFKNDADDSRNEKQAFVKVLRRAFVSARDSSNKRFPDLTLNELDELYKIIYWNFWKQCEMEEGSFLTKKECREKKLNQKSYQSFVRALLIVALELSEEAPSLSELYPVAAAQRFVAMSRCLLTYLLCNLVTCLLSHLVT